MHLPSVVVFDLGKVLLDFDYSIAARKIAARAKSKPDAIRVFVDHMPVLLRYETGLLTREEFFAEICALTGYDGDIEEFGLYFGDIFSPIEPMIELHAAIHREKIPTWIFSNTNDLAIEHIRRNFPFFKNFDGYIFSHEQGSMKPEVKIYEALERMAGRRGSEILYIDDRPENIDAGAARGWQTILHESPGKTRAAIRELKLIHP